MTSQKDSSADLALSVFDRDMVRHFRYHRKLVRLCRVLAAIHVNAALFERLAPKELKHKRDNQKIRWAMEDRIRDLLRQNGDFPK